MMSDDPSAEERTVDPNQPVAAGSRPPPIPGGWQAPAVGVSPVPVLPLDPPRVLSVLAILALVVPVIGGTFLYFVQTGYLSVTIGLSVVVVSATLVAIDLYRLGREQSAGLAHPAPGSPQPVPISALLVGMILMWIIGYPAAFFRRQQFARPRLGWVAVLVALYTFGGPTLYHYLGPKRLPAADSDDVIKLVEQIIRQGGGGARMRSIDGHHETGYDAAAEQRTGECVLHTFAGGDIPVKYVVEWESRDHDRFIVRVAPAGLPACNSPEVVMLADKLIRQMAGGKPVNSIRGYRETSIDPSTGQHNGECVLTIGEEAIPVRYQVVWTNREKGLYEVQILRWELPACDDPQVTELVEKLVAESVAPARVLSIDGYRETKFESTPRRWGECVARLQGENRPIQFTVEWQSPERGPFLVKLAP